MSFFSIFKLFLIFSLIKLSLLTAIAIDFGSEFITTSLIKSRKPIELIENPMSQTKTNQYLSISNHERVFGYNAKVKIAKNPETVFHNMQEFLGKLPNSTKIQDYIKNYFQSYEILSDKDSNQIRFKVKYDDIDYLLSSEEITAMMLKYIKLYSEKYSNSDVLECVITIPSFYNYKQRQSLISAVELSGMRLLRFIHDNTAAAIKYFNDKRYTKEEQYFMFYNMGASFTQVSLFSIKSTYAGSKSDMTENQYIKVIDEEFNENLGGRNFDYHLAKLIYKKYMKKENNKDLTEEDLNNINKDIIQRILPYALKYKEMLSANKEIPIKILGIEKGNEYEDILTRDEFLEISKNDLNKVYEPIKLILERNKISIERISQIEFIGGGHRIPKIKEIINEFIPENKMGVHTNGDDVISLGAGIYTSNLLGMNQSIKGMKKKIFLENNGYAIDTKIEILNVNLKKNQKFCEDDLKELALDNCIRKINKSTIIIKKFSDLPVEKSVSFSHDSDFEVNLYQNDEKILNVLINKLNSDAIPELKKKNPTLFDNIKDIRIKVILSLDKLGMITIKPHIMYNVNTFYTLVKPKGGGKIDFRYISKEPEELSESEIEKLIEEINKSKDYSSDDKKKYTKILKSGDVNKKSKVDKRTKYVYIKEENYHQVQPLPFTKEQISKSKIILKKFDDYEKKNLKFVEKKNDLENFIYSKREWINNKEENKRYAKENELKEFDIKLTELKEWYDLNSEKADLDSIEKKLKEAKESYKIFLKRKELEKKRNNSFKYFHSELNSILKQGKNWISEKPWIESYYNTTFTDYINELKKWIEEKEEQQSKLMEYEESVFDKQEMDKKLEELRIEAKKMKNIPRPISTEKSDL